MFVRGGGVTPSDALYSAGNYGYYWSSVGRSSSSAYGLRFGSVNVTPSYNNTWYLGFSVRCVALGG